MSMKKKLRINLNLKETQNKTLIPKNDQIRKKPVKSINRFLKWHL